MDRTIVYPGAIPLDTDILNVQRDAMKAIGFLAQSTIGAGMYADGLACTQTTVPSMSVLIGPGSITAISTLDATAFGSLAADNTDALVKQGINLLSTTLAATAPATPGQSINYLVEATFQEQDAVPVVLPYYNSANPAVAYSGPANSGASQNTRRLQTVVVQLKAGTPATTGTQTTPAPDSGYVGLYAVTVSYGATSIVNANIAPLATAPFITTKLGTFATAPLSGAYAADTSGAANTITLTFSPAFTSYTSGIMFVRWKMANAVTGATVVNVNGLGNKSLVKPDGSAMVTGDLLVGTECLGVYDGTNMVLVSNTANAVKKSDFGGGLTASNYFKLPSGHILQWTNGVTVTGNGGDGFTNQNQAISFPTTFPNAVFQVAVSTSMTAVTTSGDMMFQVYGAPTTSGCNVQCQFFGGGTSTGSTYTPIVFAIGY